LPEHSPVQLTVESSQAANGGKRVLGLQRGAILFVAPDFDTDLGEEFWFGETA
jgi:hypothetical protein